MVMAHLLGQLHSSENDLTSDANYVDIATGGASKKDSNIHVNPMFMFRATCVTNEHEKERSEYDMKLSAI